jgi:dihydroorotase
MSATSLIPIDIAGCLSRGRAGAELAELGEMRSRGAILATDDPAPIDNPLLLRRALAYAQGLDLLVATVPDVRELSAGGMMHDGRVAYRMGLAGIHPCAEEIGIARDIRLAESCGARLHLRSISTAKGVDTIRRYKREGALVTADVAPHHLIFTDEDVRDYNTSFKVKPPLRNADDVAALLAGLEDGTIDAIATDHQPFTEYEKTRDFASAPFGITGLATALPALHDSLVTTGYLSWGTLVERLSAAPRRVLGLPIPEVADGRAANAALFDPSGVSEVTPEFLYSKSKNTPLLGRQLRGRVERVFLGTQTFVF